MELKDVFGDGKEVQKVPSQLLGLETSEASWIRLGLVSNKTRVDATRSLPATNTELCPVKAMRELYLYILEHSNGKLPKPDDPVFFSEKNQKVLSAAEMNLTLKFAFSALGFNTDDVASHSLRRGGLSAYLAAGGNRELLQVFGFWHSLRGMLSYEWIDGAALFNTIFEAQQGMPMLERTYCY